jgi:mevalonate kinase
MKVCSASGVGTATGKTIVLGEHLVVHGSAALAVPISTLVETVRAQRISTPAKDSSSTVRLSGPGIDVLVSAFVDLFDVPAAVASDLVLEASGDLPYGRGLGASAAMARAAVMALSDLFGCEPTSAQVYDLVQLMERTTHGAPSGVDAAASGATAPIVFRRGLIRHVHPAPVGVFVVADSGEVSATKDSVASVGEALAADSEALVRRTKLVERVDALVAGAVVDLQRGNLTALGAAMNQNHELLQGLQLSTPGLERLVAAANASGALGAKLTGGGRGGCVLALARDSASAQIISASMVNAGAVATWAVALDSFAGEVPATSSGCDVAL